MVEEATKHWGSALNLASDHKKKEVLYIHKSSLEMSFDKKQIYAPRYPSLLPPTKRDPSEVCLE